MTRVDLITGFLGSGKTTFIKKYASYLAEKKKKICILENDYGAINVDMMLLSELENKGVDLEMVAGGCGYDCHRRRFKTKLITMAMLGYDRVIIEPSGIFDVDEFFDILHEEPLDRLYEIGNVITIIKADLEDDLSDEADFMLASQTVNAGCVLLSQTQEVEKNRIEATVRHLNNALKKVKSKRKMTIGTAEVISKNWDDLDANDYEMIENSGYKSESFEKKFSMDDSSFDAFFFMNIDMDYDKIKDAIKDLFENKTIGRIMRVKGFAKSKDKWFEINATKKGINENEISKGQNVIIVIGENLDKGKINTFFNAGFSTVKTE